jgi:hypothetical protein
VIRVDAVAVAASSVARSKQPGLVNRSVLPVELVWPWQAVALIYLFVAGKLAAAVAFAILGAPLAF